MGAQQASGCAAPAAVLPLLPTPCWIAVGLLARATAPRALPLRPGVAGVRAASCVVEPDPLLSRRCWGPTVPARSLPSWSWLAALPARRFQVLVLVRWLSRVPCSLLRAAAGRRSRERLLPGLFYALGHYSWDTSTHARWWRLRCCPRCSGPPNRWSSRQVPAAARRGLAALLLLAVAGSGAPGGRAAGSRWCRLARARPGPVVAQSPVVLGALLLRQPVVPVMLAARGRDGPTGRQPRLAAARPDGLIFRYARTAGARAALASGPLGRPWRARAVRGVSIALALQFARPAGRAGSLALVFALAVRAAGPPPPSVSLVLWRSLAARFSPARALPGRLLVSAAALKWHRPWGRCGDAAGAVARWRWRSSSISNATRDDPRRIWRSAHHRVSCSRRPPRVGGPALRSGPALRLGHAPGHDARDDARAGEPCHFGGGVAGRTRTTSLPTCRPAGAATHGHDPMSSCAAAGAGRDERGGGCRRLFLSDPGRWSAGRRWVHVRVPRCAPPVSQRDQIRAGLRWPAPLLRFPIRRP